MCFLLSSIIATCLSINAITNSINVKYYSDGTRHVFSTTVSTTAVASEISYICAGVVVYDVAYNNVANYYEYAIVDSQNDANYPQESKIVAASSLRTVSPGIYVVEGYGVVNFHHLTASNEHLSDSKTVTIGGARASNTLDMIMQMHNPVLLDTVTCGNSIASHTGLDYSGMRIVKQVDIKDYLDSDDDFVGITRQLMLHAGDSLPVYYFDVDGIVHAVKRDSNGIEYRFDFDRDYSGQFKCVQIKTYRG